MRAQDLFLLLAFILLVSVVVHFSSGCESTSKMKCTYQCDPNADPPVGCYCVEDKILVEIKEM